MGESGMSHARSGGWANRMKSIHGLRKRNKPLVEKKRRARINESLAQLKSLVLESMHRTSGPCSKLEKADILEMTVRHMRQLKQQLNERELVSKYRVGYNECANDVMRYLGKSSNMDTETRSRLIDRLSDRMETGSHVRIQPRSETFTPPSTEVTVRLGNHYDSLLQIAPTGRFAVSTKNEPNKEPVLTNHLSIHENVTENQLLQHNNNKIPNTCQDTLYNTPSVTLPGYMADNISEQGHGYVNRVPSEGCSQSLPLCDIAPGTNSHNRNKCSVNRKVPCTREYCTPTKQQLPPFRVFAETLRQGSRRNSSTNSCANVQHAAVLHRTKWSVNTQSTLSATEYGEPTIDTVRSPSPHDMIPNGLLGIAQSNVWRPW